MTVVEGSSPSDGLIDLVLGEMRCGTRGRLPGMERATCALSAEQIRSRQA